MTIKFDNKFIENYYTVLGRNEHNITIRPDKLIDDYYNKQKSFELGEMSYQIESIKGLLKKSKLKEKDVDLLVSGDLQNELLASNFAARNFDIPFIGYYSACASFVGGLIIAANIVADVLIAMKDSFRRYLRDGGILIVSGIIEERMDEVIDALISAGFKAPEPEVREGWAAVKFTV